MFQIFVLCMFYNIFDKTKHGYTTFCLIHCDFSRVFAVFCIQVARLEAKRAATITHTIVYNQARYNMLTATPQILEDMDCYLPDNNAVRKIAAFFALLSDPSRIKLLSALAISPLCVTDLSTIVDMNQTTVSHQLRLLRNLDIVTTERNGKIIKYKLANPKINEILLVGVEYLGY